VLRALSPLAILLAMLVGYALPFVAMAQLAAPLLGKFTLSGGNGGAIGFFLWVVIAALSPLVTGYVAARLSKSLPLLHGLIAGALAVLVAIQFTGFQGVVGGIILWALGPPMLGYLAMTVVTVVLFLVGAITGAYFARKRGVAA
jgi:hypothetical protein